MKLADLNEVGFFEGTEKLLEIWFTSDLISASKCDLRAIPRYNFLILKTNNFVFL